MGSVTFYYLLSVDENNVPETRSEKLKVSLPGEGLNSDLGTIYEPTGLAHAGLPKATSGTLNLAGVSFLRAYMGPAWRPPGSLSISSLDGAGTTLCTEPCPSPWQRESQVACQEGGGLL